jgi:hypothetical protein
MLRACCRLGAPGPKNNKALCFCIESEIAAGAWADVVSEPASVLHIYWEHVAVIYLRISGVPLIKKDIG